MTVDILVVSETDKDSFAKTVFNEVTHQERMGYTCEIKFATVEKDRAWGNVQYNALIHVYETEQ